MYVRSGDADVSSYDKLYGYRGDVPHDNRRLQVGAKFEF